MRHVNKFCGKKLNFRNARRGDTPAHIKYRALRLIRNVRKQLSKGIQHDVLRIEKIMSYI
jgi:hypothetical protein